MQRSRIKKVTRRKVLLNVGGLFEALGVELTEEQRDVVEHTKAQEEKDKQSRKEAAQRWAKEHREELNERNRKSRAENPERWREYDRRKREKNREAILERDRAWKAAHKEEINKRRREQYAARREEEAAKARERRAANREAYNAHMREYHAGRREIINACNRASRAADPERWREYDRRKYERQKAAKAARATLPNPKTCDNVGAIGTIRAAENPKKGETVERIAGS